MRRAAVVKLNVDDIDESRRVINVIEKADPPTRPVMQWENISWKKPETWRPCNGSSVIKTQLTRCNTPGSLLTN